MVDLMEKNSSYESDKEAAGMDKFGTYTVWTQKMKILW